jgi:hypothetical protein
MKDWISWSATITLALIIARIMWVEIKCGRKNKSALSSTSEQINSIKQSATERYRAKFGRDPTGTFEQVDLPQVASKK